MRRPGLQECVLLGLLACAGCRAPRATTPAESPPAPTSERAITLRRTHCYGPCPVYAVTLFADGRVAWVGHDNVARIGPASGRVAPKAVESVLEALDRVDLSKVPTEFPREDVCATDSPAAILTIVDRTSKVRAFDYHGCDGAVLEQLRRVETEIDKVADVDRWIWDKNCSPHANTIYFPPERIDVLEGGEPMDVWRRHVLDEATATLRAHPELSLRLRSSAEGHGRGPKRIESAKNALITRGIDARRIVTWVLEGEDAIDPLGWNREALTVETGPAACLAVSPS